MVIQKLLFPKNEICADTEMFFRDASDAWVSRDEDEFLNIPRGNTISLETYFNAFSAAKWKRYTTISDVSLSFRYAGEIEVRAHHSWGWKDEPEIYDAYNDDMLYRCIHSDRKEIDADISFETKRKRGRYPVMENVCTVRFPDLPARGIFYVTITAKSDAVLYGGAYETEKGEKEARPARLSLGICTFRREEFVKKNVGLVLKNIIKNPRSPLYGNCEVYISDNGQTLPADTFSNANVHLFPNKNLGGAGGFTRTMIEALFYRKNDDASKNFTHIILMDDDIVLSTDVLERTYLFLRHIKNKYKNAMLGGSMFTLDKRYIQFEAGATWKGIEVQFYNKMWDLRRRDTVSANEELNPLNYSGWWYNVIPTSVITKDNLPLPLFIHYDDIEYGKRNAARGNETILLNGICVWHPQGANKAPVRMTYYDVRNMLISMSKLPDRSSAFDIIRHLTNRVIGGVIRYRYEDAEICYEALDDFYKGADYFMSLDTLKRHAELEAFNLRYETPEEAGIDRSKKKEHTYHHFEKLVFLWGLFLWLLPPVRELKIAEMKDIGLPFGARKVFHYDDQKDIGVMTEHSYARAWKDFVKYCETVLTIGKHHEEMMDDWADKKAILTSLAFWEKYLELSETER